MEVFKIYLELDMTTWFDLDWTDDDGNDEINTALHWADDILQENDLRPKAIAVTLCWQRGIRLHFGFHFVLCPNIF